MKEQLLRFLLVEDDDNHAHLVVRSLEKNRIKNTIDRVKDGQAAIDYLFDKIQGPLEKLPDIILLDLKLPKLDGLEVLERIKAEPRLNKIPVVMLTTSDAERDRARAYEHHVNSYVVKPVDFDKFRQLINDLGYYWGVWNQPAPKQQEETAAQL